MGVHGVFKNYLGKWIVMGLLIILAFMVLGGCGGKKKQADDVQEEEITLRIGVFFMKPYLQNCAADYEKTHPGVSVEFVEFENPFQNSLALNRLAEECKAGEGPDMICFTMKEHIETLSQAGCLASMDGMLSEETKKGLFGCVLELGETEDGIYGIPFGVYLRCYLTAGENGKRESWTARDIMNCYQERREKEDNMERVFGIAYPQSSQDLLYELCLLNLEGSPYVDFEKETCSFESQEFCDLLTFCKENAEAQGNQKYLNSEEVISQMLSEQAFLYLYAGGLSTYSHDRSCLGKDFYPIGIASSSSASPDGSYIAVSNDFLTMNAFSDNRKLASDFLEYVLSESCQVKFGNGDWVRKDVIESHVREHVRTEMILEDGSVSERTECHFVMDDGKVMPLAVDENGDSFVKEYLAIMDKARVYASHPELRAIISEEADAFFTGDKTAEEVSHLIQNRVELFLKE